MSASWLIGLVFLGWQVHALGATELVAEQELSVREAGGTAVKVLQPGEALPLNPKTPLLLESPGHVAVMVLAVPSEMKRVTVRLKPLSDTQPLAFWKSMDQMLGEIQKVQEMLRGRKSREALSMANDLLARYPHMTRLRLLKASCLMVLGQRDAAQALISEGNQPVEAEISSKLTKTPPKGEEPQPERSTASESAPPAIEPAVPAESGANSEGGQP